MQNICNGWNLNDYQHINFSPDDSFGEANRAWQGCPSIAVTKNGRLFSAWFSGGDFEPCINNYNVLNLSDDGGKSWSGTTLIWGRTAFMCAEARARR